MVTDKALYLTAAVVLAFGITGSYASKHSDWTACLSDRSVQVAENVAARITSRAEGLLGRAEGRLGRTESVVARVQVRVASVQDALARRQTEVVRQQVEKLRLVSDKQMTRAVIVCSDKNNADINEDTPAAPDPDEDTN